MSPLAIVLLVLFCGFVVLWAVIWGVGHLFLDRLAPELPPLPPTTDWDHGADA